MRIDRFLTLHVFGPLLGLSRQPERHRLPILMYHSISDEIDDHARPYFRTVTSPATFARQMRFLSESQYQAITLSQALQSMRDPLQAGGKNRTPQRPIVVTFDDGFRDIYTTAFPILERHGFKATVFLSTEYIGREFITGRRCLSADEVRELAAQGLEFGSHTATHPQLKELASDKIHHELSASKRRIEEITGSEVTVFSYPYRFPEEDPHFIEELGNLLTQTGYVAGVTTSIGRSDIKDAPLFMKRLPVNDGDDLELFEAKLNGAYDWLHKGQIAYKKLRAASRRRSSATRL